MRIYSVDQNSWRVKLWLVSRDKLPLANENVNINVFNVHKVTCVHNTRIYSKKCTGQFFFGTVSRIKKLMS